MAIERVEEAKTADDGGDYEKACRLYLQSVAIIQKCIGYSKEKSQKDVYTQKAMDILDRVETLKKCIASGADSSSGNRAGGDGQKGGNTKEKDNSAFRDSLESCIVRTSPNVTWDMIAGLDSAKEALKESVILPVRFPQLFKGKRRPWKGILLYGPPGTGKSYLAKAIATESDGTFITVSSADLISKWMGESEKLVRNMFEMSRDIAKETQRPTIIFIDELDSLASSRSEEENEATRRVKTEFLVQMQGVTSDESDGVLVLGATNIPWALDTAILRRFERRIYIPLPDVPGRVQMFKIHMGSTPNTLTEDNWRSLADDTPLYSGSDIENVVRNALMEGVRTLQLATHFKKVPGPDPNDPTKMVNDRLVPCSPGDPDAFEATMMSIKDPQKVMDIPVTYAHFRKSLMSCKPAVTQAQLKKLNEFTTQSGQAE